MRYLVLETHPAWAVVLDQDGRFIKAANMHYKVGQRVDQITQLEQPKAARTGLIRYIAGLAAAAAVFCAVFFGYYRPNYTPYGTVSITINPLIEMTVSRTERVLEAVGLNGDGQRLISGLELAGRSRAEATRQIVDEAIELGYLSPGESVTVSIDSADEDWLLREEELARAELTELYGDAITIYIGDETPQEPESPEAAQDDVEIIVPVPEDDATDYQPPTATEDDSGYQAPEDDSGYSDGNYQVPEIPPESTPGQGGSSVYQDSSGYQDNSSYQQDSSGYSDMDYGEDSSGYD